MIPRSVASHAGSDQGAFGERSPDAGERFRGRRLGSRGRLVGALVVAALVVCGVRLGQQLLLEVGPRPEALVTTFFQNLLAAGAWVLVGWGVVGFARRVPFRRGELLWVLPAHVAGIGAAALAVNVLVGVAWATTGLWPGEVGFWTLVLTQTVAHLHANALVYSLLVVGTRAWDGARPSDRVQDRGPGSAPRPTQSEARGLDAPAADGDFLERIPVPDGRRTLLLDVERIDWIEADGDYVTVHVDARDFLVSERMHVLEVRLDPDRFARVHRSAIVNLDRVRELMPRPAGNATLLLRDGTRVPLARRRRGEVEERLGVRGMTSG